MLNDPLLFIHTSNKFLIEGPFNIVSAPIKNMKSPLALLTAKLIACDGGILSGVKFVLSNPFPKYTKILTIFYYIL